MHSKLLTLLTVILMPLHAFAQPATSSPAPNAHQFHFTTLEGEALNLADYAGKVVLIVNTASQCGFTPQYAGLQQLHEEYAAKGLVVIGVPSADFGGQEFAQAEEIKAFTDKEFSVTFPLASLTTVKGDKAHPFYQWAREKAGFVGSPSWNFHKYLIDKNGNLAEWFSSMSKPTGDSIRSAIERELAK